MLDYFEYVRMAQTSVHSAQLVHVSGDFEVCFQDTCQDTMARLLLVPLGLRYELGVLCDACCAV
jgi:hypothetical protein